MRLFGTWDCAMCAYRPDFAGLFLQNFFYTMPWWLSVIVLAAHVIALLGFASLVDTRRQQGLR